MSSRFFIDRPIFAVVISLFIVLAGLAAMRVLPIAQYPEIAPPQVAVRAILRGAVRPDAIAVPQRAVMEGPQGKIVYLYGKDNKAEMRPVTVGDWAGSDWIITSGLEPGDKVIVDGLAKIFFPGAPVQLGDPNAPPPGAPGKGPPPSQGDKKAEGEKKQ